VQCIGLMRAIMEAIAIAWRGWCITNPLQDDEGTSRSRWGIVHAGTSSILNISGTRTANPYARKDHCPIA
jgi:hypothetical protein